MSSVCSHCQGTGRYQCKFHHPGQPLTTERECKFGAECRNQVAVRCTKCQANVPKKPPILDKKTVHDHMLHVDRQNPKTREDYVAILADKSAALLDATVQQKLKDGNFSIEAMLGGADDGNFIANAQQMIATLEVFIAMMQQ